MVTRIRYSKLILLFFVFISKIILAQYDSICNLAIIASTDSIVYIEIGKEEITNPDGFKYTRFEDRAIYYSRVDSIIEGDYAGNKIVFESGPLYSNQSSKETRPGVIETHLLGGSYARYKGNYSKRRFRLRKEEGKYIICPEKLEINKMGPC